MVAGQRIIIEIPVYTLLLIKWAKPRAQDEADGTNLGRSPAINWEPEESLSACSPTCCGT